MIDELFHECSVDTELVFGVVKKIQSARKEVQDQPSSLRLIFAVSGNSNEQGNQVKELVDFFGDKDTRVCIIPGRQYALDIFFAENNMGADYVKASAECAIAVHRRESTNGDVLIFLPSAAEVDECVSLLNEFTTPREAPTLEVLLLYAGISAERRHYILNYETSRRIIRRIIVATSVAESKITVPNIKFVIDAGMSKQLFFDAHSGCELTGKTISSKATIHQRTSRAGRDCPGGKCYRLYTEDAFTHLCPETDPPATARSDLTWPLLRLKALGVDNVLDFDLVHPAPAALLLCALDELRALGALDDEAKLTPRTGILLATAPCEPRTAAFLIAAFKNSFDQSWYTAAQAVAVAAVLQTGRHTLRGPLPRYSTGKRQQIEHAFRDDLVHLDGDHATMVNILAAWPKSNEWAKARGIDVSAVKSALAIRARLAYWLNTASISDSIPSESQWYQHLLSPQDQNTTTWDTMALRRALVTGFFSRAARLANDASYRAVKADRTIVLDPSSVYSEFGTPPPFICFCEYALDDDLNVRARHIARIDPRWLLEQGDYYTLDKNVGLT
eukprot:CAMPEP_0197303454 /NCGR_PEP_ID=MMETSP0890-20130614/51672_1 /TAXON_ID=44058 ORGANISM="Aureoumbra lagunensis, Strain CCMP1510" /NCGR_SAMPLE_ID=MMETSP0890 /ASSEMBLY_ACC=CAM_ASM_000533 /LENGTH=559 /DNA_ID=CAMNT_0042783283 /DNA_START=414 /DNA_END=2093 /DNA_ORIENTATION=+